MFANDFFLEITGWTRGEVLNRSWVDIFVPIIYREKTLNTHMLISDGIIEAPIYEDKEILTKNGCTLSFEWNNSVIKDSHGKFLGISSIGKPRECLSISLPESQPTQPNSNQNEISSVSKKRIGNYVLIKALGGENGHVQLAIHELTNEKVAVKSLKKNQMTPEELERARREIQIMEQLTDFGNPYIIRLLGWHETATHFNIIVEYVAGGELVGLIKSSKRGLSEDHSRKLFKQMVCALECCHQHQIVHRDLKLQNILVDESGNIKLIDFGLSNFVENGIFRNTFCGTPAFAPPEILLGTQYKGPEVDIWSLGVVLYSMLSGEFPFKTIGEILNGKFKNPTNVSPECVDLLNNLLVVKKEERIRLESVIVHPWMFNDDRGLKKGSSGNIQEPHLKRRRSC